MIGNLRKTNIKLVSGDYLIMRAYRMLSERKTPIIAADLNVSVSSSARRALELLVKLDIAEIVSTTVRNGNVSKSTKSYILKKSHKEECIVKGVRNAK